MARLAAGAGDGRTAPRLIVAWLAGTLLGGLALLALRGRSAWLDLVAALKVPGPGLGPNLAAFLLAFGALQVGGGLAASTLPRREVVAGVSGDPALPVPLPPGGLTIPPGVDPPRARLRWAQLGPVVEALASDVRVAGKDLAPGQARALEPGQEVAAAEWRASVRGPTPGETSRALVLGQVAGLFLVLGALGALGGREALNGVGLRTEGFGREVWRGLIGWIGTLPIYVLALVATGLIANLVGFKVSGHDLVRALEREGLALLLPALLQAALLAPLAEELLFRGLLLPGLQRALGPLTGFLGCALAFACVHGSLGFLLPMTVLGSLFAGLRLTSPTGSLVAPITAHALHNGVTLALVGAVLLLSG